MKFKDRITCSFCREVLSVKTSEPSEHIVRALINHRAICTSHPWPEELALRASVKNTREYMQNLINTYE